MLHYFCELWHFEHWKRTFASKRLLLLTSAMQDDDTWRNANRPLFSCPLSSVPAFPALLSPKSSSGPISVHEVSLINEVSSPNSNSPITQQFSDGVSTSNGGSLSNKNLFLCIFGDQWKYFPLTNCSTPTPARGHKSITAAPTVCSHLVSDILHSQLCLTMRDFCLCCWDPHL